MRTEGDFIKIHEWLTPLSWLYGFGVGVRNLLFKLGILKSRAFDIPVISVGNITVGGSGKTPHVEYLVSLLQDKMKVAVLSRGYKRKSKGYVLAPNDCTMAQIGDEPYQMKQKFPHIYVAVDKKRTRGIDKLTTDATTKDVDVILLDDAYQHRYVKPGVNILLIDYHRLIIYDKLLPAGCLREPKEGKSRADIVIITKCPKDLRPMEYRVLTKALDLYPYQSLYFTTLAYDPLKQVYGNKTCQLDALPKQCNVLLLTGIASPKQMYADLSTYHYNLHQLTFPDHHNFSKKDVRKINSQFAEMPAPKVIITTEKDASRIKFVEGLEQEVKDCMYVLPVRIQFMLEQEENFNNKIINYVRKNSRNSILVKTKDDNKPQNGNHPRNGAGPISFRNN